MIVAYAIAFVLQSIKLNAAALSAKANIGMLTSEIIITRASLHAASKAICWYWVCHKVNHAANGLRAIQNFARALNYFNTLHALQRCRKVSRRIAIRCQK